MINVINTKSLNIKFQLLPKWGKYIIAFVFKVKL